MNRKYSFCVKKCPISKRGGMTVEACIALPVFLGFFLLLLFLIKIASINMLLDHAVNETAKQLATSAYPVSFLNELEDGIIEEYGESKVESFHEGLKGIAFNSIKDAGSEAVGDAVSGRLNKEIIDKVVSSGFNGLKKGVGGYFVNLFKDSYWQIKDRGRYLIAGKVMEKYLEDKLIDKSRLRLSVAELPQGDREYEACKAAFAFSDTGLIPDEDFGSDDVVVQVEYKYEIQLPVFGKREIVFRHTAIEKGWLHGSDGVYAQREEGLELEELDREEALVYVTRTGTRYHKDGCRYLKRSRIPMEAEDARSEGYTSCKVCKPYMK